MFLNNDLMATSVTSSADAVLRLLVNVAKYSSLCAVVFVRTYNHVVRISTFLYIYIYIIYIYMYIYIHTYVSVNFLA